MNGFVDNTRVKFTRFSHFFLALSELVKIDEKTKSQAKQANEILLLKFHQNGQRGRNAVQVIDDHGPFSFDFFRS